MLEHADVAELIEFLGGEPVIELARGFEFAVGGAKVVVHANVQQFDFSSQGVVHAGRSRGPVVEAFHSY